MKKILCFILLSFVSCNKNIEEYHPNGKLKISIQTDKNNVPDGDYVEYYESGKLKAKTRYHNGLVNDTFFHYYENGRLKEKGIMTGNYKHGWWILYDMSGHLINKTEYYSDNNKQYRNQWIDFNTNGDTIFSTSNFYKLYIHDTLIVGKNLAKIKYYSPSKYKDKFYEIAIDNQISDVKVDKDTFPEEGKTSRFGIYAHKSGVKEVKGNIVLNYFDMKKINNDSMSATQFQRITTFKKKIYVKPGG